MYYVPGSPLSEFVELFWYFRGDEVPNAKERVLPTGAVDLIIRLDSARTSDSGMQGPRTRPVVITTTSRHELIGVHFRLGGAFPFLQFPVGELQNAGISLSDLWGERDAQRLLSMLDEAPTGKGKFRILERWLLQLAADRWQKHPAVTFAMRAFCSGPSGSFGSAAEVAHKTGYSQRHFIELFRKEVGLKPKEFHRLYRFRKVIDAVQRQTVVDWADIGLSVGYFDQAHLIHDFRQFSDLTPEQYLKSRTPFINHVRIAD
jgi:AraC-like DNA-binding protein